jgi:hypothetical protein
MIAAGAQAQIDPDPDGIGIYFDEGATEHCLFTSVPYQPVTAYLCVTNLSEPLGLDGWEATVIVEGEGLLTPVWTVLHNGTNFLVPPAFAVGYSYDDCPQGPVIVLIRIDAVVADPSLPVSFRIDAAPTPSIPGHDPVWEPCTGWWFLFPLHQSSGSHLLPVATVNLPDCAVPNAVSTWGAVKALYE